MCWSGRTASVAPGGTITRTVWTTPQWVASIWIGTNDTGATDSDPTGGGAPATTWSCHRQHYDSGTDGGDGNLTQQTQYVSATPATPASPALASTSATARPARPTPPASYTCLALDNLGRPTHPAVRQLHRQPDRPERRRLRRPRPAVPNVVYAVDPTTGAVGNVLTSNTWFDPSGNVVQQIAPATARVFTKNAFNGVNWVTATLHRLQSIRHQLCPGPDRQRRHHHRAVQNTFDEAGNTISVASFQRLNDASPSDDGPLTGSNARIYVFGTPGSMASAADRDGNYGAAAASPGPRAARI